MSNIVNTDWTANDFSNLITISAAAIGSVLLIVFKSRCKEVNFCYLIKCKRDVVAEHDEAVHDDESILPLRKPKPAPAPAPEPEPASS